MDALIEGHIENTAPGLVRANGLVADVHDMFLRDRRMPTLLELEAF